MHRAQEKGSSDPGTESTATQRGPGRLRVLLADDDSALVNGYEASLKKAGYEVVGKAYDGLSAVDLCRALHPDLVVMDIKMPRMDGIEAARRINRGDTATIIPVVLVTAYADKSLVDRAKHCGVLGYLVKPVHMDDLVPALELAYTTAQRISALEGVVHNLSEDIETRKLVERAKGILMKRLNMEEEEAMQLMQKESRRQRIKLKDLAQAILSSHALMA